MAIRLTVVGAGSRGRDWIREIRRHPEFSLAACVDVDPEALALAKADGVPADALFPELDQSLARTPCDAVVVATSADQHVAACRKSIEHRLPLLVEKPFTTSLAEAVAIVEAAEAAGSPVVVAQNFRYLRGFRTARAFVASGKLGIVRQVGFHYHHGRHHMAQSLARMRHNVLWGVGVHHLDAMRVILGQRAVRLLARDFTATDGVLPDGASMQVLLDFDAGTRALYTATYESSGHEFFERGQEFYGRITGSSGTLHLSHRWLIFCPTGGWPRLVRRGTRSMTEEEVLLRQLEAAMRGEKVDSSGRDNLETMAIVQACIESSERGAWIDPSEMLRR